MGPIIRLGEGTASNIYYDNKEKTWKDGRKIGAAIYIGSNAKTPAVQLTTKVIEKILK